MHRRGKTIFLKLVNANNANLKHILPFLVSIQIQAEFIKWYSDLYSFVDIYQQFKTVRRKQKYLRTTESVSL